MAPPQADKKTSFGRGFQRLGLAFSSKNYGVASAAADSNPVTFAMPLSTTRSANEPSRYSSTNNAFRTAWHGVQQLLQKVERSLAGTPFQGPVGALNSIIEVINAVADNQDALQERTIQTAKRLELVNAALLKAESDTAKFRMQAFSARLISEAVRLREMSPRSEWTKILENKENKKTIEESFKRIDEYTKDFHLDIIMSIERNTDEMQESLTQLRLGSWPHSKLATYNVDLEGTETLFREPCTGGTRVDILERIYLWALNSLSDSPHVFWLTGQAGSGKSTIAYTVADHFDDVEDASTDRKYILGANFFCSRQFEETKRRKYIIPTIAYQLARQSRSYASALLRANKSDSANVPAKQMRDLLVGPWQRSAGERSRRLRPYLIVIDALDEIEGNGGSAFLQELLKTISQGHLHGLKFLVTSRPDPELAALCSSFNSDAVCRLYEVPTDTVQADIVKYLRVKLPSLQDPLLAKLSREADGLFIYAATAVRYIRRRDRMTTDEQLRMVAQLADHMSSGADTPLLIDTLYQQILWGAFRNLPDALFHDRLKILHTLLCTEERVSASLAGRLSGVVDVQMAKVVVDELHAVLYVKNDRVLWYHASFPDFMFAQGRSIFSVPWGAGSCIVNMSCDEPSHHARLTHSCFRIMKSDLRFNICDLPSSFLFDSEVPDLSHRIQENISNVLQYSCRYWVQHLNRAASSNRDSLQARIDKFLHVRVLFWIEAMNLLGSRSQCSPILQIAREWVLKVNDEGSSDLALHLAEAANFATYFGASPAAQSTPHLYMSSLMTWSRDSTMAQLWKSQFSRGPSFKQTQGDHNVPLLTLRHDGPVTSVAFSSDRSRIASGSSDNSVRVWDASTGGELMRLNGHTGWVTSVAFSSDGTRIVSGSEDQSVRVWDTSTGAELTRLDGHTDGLESAAFSSDGTYILSGSRDKSVRLWDASTGVVLARVNLGSHTDYIRSVMFSDDGTRIVWSSDDCSLRVWDALTSVELTRLKGHTDLVTSLAFSSDGIRVVSGSYDMSVRVWDASTGAELMRLNGHTHRVYSVAFSSDATHIVSGSDGGSVRVWNASTGAELTRLNAHTNRVKSVAFSSDGTRILSGSYDRSVLVWDVPTGAALTRRNGHTHSVQSVAFSSDGTRIVSGLDDWSVRVWDASTGMELTRLNGHTDAVYSVAFSCDGTRIVSGSYDKSIQVWDASTGAELMRLNGHTDNVNSVALSSDGTRIVSGSYDMSVRVWDASTGGELARLNGHTGLVSSVAFSSDGTRIASSSGDTSVRVWDASTGVELTRLNGHIHLIRSMGYSSDGTRIVSSSYDKSVRVWDASTGAELTRLNGHTDIVNSVAFSSDGTRIVSGSYDMSVRVWDALTGAELARLQGHTDRINSVAFSSDGTRIVSGSSDGSVRVWDASTSAELTRLNGRARHGDSIALSSDGTHIVSGFDNNFNPAWNMAQHQDQWMITPDNWIVWLPYRKRLMSVPPQIIEVLCCPHNPLIISPKGSATVDYIHPQIGMDWAGCYTP